MRGSIAVYRLTDRAGVSQHNAAGPAGLPAADSERRRPHHGLERRLHFVPLLAQRVLSEAHFLRLAGHCRRDVEPDFPQSVPVRDHAVGLEVRIIEAVGDGLRRDHEKALRDVLGLAADRTKGHAGKDVDVVDLPGVVRAAVDLHGLKLRAGTVDDLALRPRVCILGRDLGLRPGIRQGKDDWALCLVLPGGEHRLNDLLGEAVGHHADGPDHAARLQVGDDAH
mmetsp:Transcript_36887/g.60175  ORF Transcript_36887/g.60175 Transcript_36887/m.60175 type:complete len:224 (-) Transcript_36887:1213-1884(-)